MCQRCMKFWFLPAFGWSQEFVVLEPGFVAACLPLLQLFPWLGRATPCGGTSTHSAFAVHPSFAFSPLFSETTSSLHLPPKWFVGAFVCVSLRGSCFSWCMHPILGCCTHYEWQPSAATAASEHWQCVLVLPSVFFSSPPCSPLYFLCLPVLQAGMLRGKFCQQNSIVENCANDYGENDSGDSMQAVSDCPAVHTQVLVHFSSLISASCFLQNDRFKWKPGMLEQIVSHTAPPNRYSPKPTQCVAPPQHRFPQNFSAPPPKRQCMSAPCVVNHFHGVVYQGAFPSVPFMHSSTTPGLPWDGHFDEPPSNDTPGLPWDAHFDEPPSNEWSEDCGGPGFESQCSMDSVDMYFADDVWW